MPGTEIVDVLACPRCEQPLQHNSDASWACPHCAVKFPSVAGIPCLFAEPAATLTEWRMRLQFALEKLAHDASGLQSELQNPRLRTLTRERLTLLSRAHVDQGRRLRELLAPLGIHNAQAALATHLALQTRLPADQGLTTYYPNVHRDWAWGDRENEAALALVAESFGTGKPERLLVLGAGAGRLAYDLHQRRGPGLSIALDFNPLLVLVGKRASEGTATNLWEFPIAPRRIQDSAVLRTLVAPERVRDGLQFLLGDALRPPILPESVDVVVTPWVVDILPEDFRTLAARINGLLAPGGRWISFGSLAFSQPDAAARYGFEEVLEIVEDSGFGEPVLREDEIPYMCSPASRHGRRELVTTFSAIKKRSVPKPARPRALPDWLVGGTLPVPMLPDFQMQTMTTRIYSFVMSMIDGRRSVKDMARLMTEQRLMTKEEAESAVRGFLTRMYEDSRRPPGF